MFRLEHLHGTVEVVAFPDGFREYGMHLVEDAAVMVCGKLLREDGVRIQASEIYPLADVPKHFTTRVSVHLPAATCSTNTCGRCTTSCAAIPAMSG